MKLLAIEDVSFGAAPEDGAGHAGLEGEACDVVGQQPGARMGHTRIFDQL